MKTWNYNQNIKSFVDLLNEICADQNINEFDLIVPKKYEKMFEELSKHNNEINNLYNIKFIDADIDYVIIDNVDVIKFENYDLYDFFINKCYVDFRNEKLYDINKNELSEKEADEFSEKFGLLSADEVKLYDPNGKELDLEKFIEERDNYEFSDLLSGKYCLEKIIKK